MFFLPALLGGITQAAGGLFGASQRRKTAATNYQISAYNAASQRSNTLAALELEKAQNAIQFETAQANAEFALLDAEARERNALRIRQFAEARSEQSRKALRRQRRAFDQLQGTQRANVAGSGVMFEGSVMDVLTDSAAQMQMALADMHDEANFERMASLDEATLEDFGAAQDRAAARASLRSAQSGFEFGNLAATVGSSRADSNFRAAMAGASSQRASQLAAARAQSFSAISGGIFAGASAFASRERATPSASVYPVGTSSNRGIFRQTYQGLR